MLASYFENEGSIQYLVILGKILKAGKWFLVHLKKKKKKNISTYIFLLNLTVECLI
jgi:hypothetical protein